MKILFKDNLNNMVKLGGLFLLSFCLTKAAFFLVFGYPILVTTIPDSIQWNGSVIPIPKDMTLKVWPDLVPYYALQQKKSHMVNSGKSKNNYKDGKESESIILLYHDDLYGRLINSAQALRSRFRFISLGSIDAINGPFPQKLICFCSRFGDSDVGQPRFLLGISIKDQPDRVEFLGERTQFNYFFKFATSILHETGSATSSRNVVRECFAGIRDQFSERLNLGMDEAKVRGFLASISDSACPKIPVQGNVK